MVSIGSNFAITVANGQYNFFERNDTTLVINAGLEDENNIYKSHFCIALSLSNNGEQLLTTLYAEHGNLTGSWALNGKPIATE